MTGITWSLQALFNLFYFNFTIVVIFIFFENFQVCYIQVSYLYWKLNTQFRSFFQYKTGKAKGQFLKERLAANFVPPVKPAKSGTTR
jgi:hypothetical protein